MTDEDRNILKGILRTIHILLSFPSSECFMLLLALKVKLLSTQSQYVIAARVWFAQIHIV